MPNMPGDLSIVTDLFDLIPTSNGGTAEIGGLWAVDRQALIAEVSAQIVIFQTIKGRPVIDGVIDPDGGTLKLMNQLAAAPSPGGPRIVPAPAEFPENPGPVVLKVADVSTMSGTGVLRPTIVHAEYVRRLVRIDESSINWFGVVVPSSGGRDGSTPHIHFTPTPIQHPCYDNDYDSFGGGWWSLWDRYTDIVGGQLAASGANQVLVIPFYQTAQQYNLGDFLSNWRELVSAVVTQAICSIDALRLRDAFTFGRILSSSFSNGWVAHRQFYDQAMSAASMTDVLFDLDGQAASPSSSNWRPQKGIKYLDRASPTGTNPVARNWYVGGRWKLFAAMYGKQYYTHEWCFKYLLYHGLWQWDQSAS
jgi:hypothetical protein